MLFRSLYWSLFGLCGIVVVITIIVGDGWSEQYCWKMNVQTTGNGKESNTKEPKTKEPTKGLSIAEQHNMMYHRSASVVGKWIIFVLIEFYKQKCFLYYIISHKVVVNLSIKKKMKSRKIRLIQSIY